MDHHARTVTTERPSPTDLGDVRRGLRSQMSVVADTLRAARHGGPVWEYDGYTVVPVVYSRKVLRGRV